MFVYCVLSCVASAHKFQKLPFIQREKEKEGKRKLSTKFSIKETHESKESVVIKANLKKTKGGKERERREGE